MKNHVKAAGSVALSAAVFCLKFLLLVTSARYVATSIAIDAQLGRKSTWRW